MSIATVHTRHTPASVQKPPAGAPVSLESVKELLVGLNREQRRAVTHRGGEV